jgi:predicted RNase H-like nuclease (RuvC/YqgF family)
VAGLTRESEGDIRAKPEYDREEFEDDRRKNNTVIAGLDPATQDIPGSRYACPGMT